VGSQARQFVGMSLELVVRIQVECIDSKRAAEAEARDSQSIAPSVAQSARSARSGADGCGAKGVKGFVIKAYDVTDLVSGVPGPDGGLSPEEQEADLKRQQR
jgi:hypothetical protein